MRTRRPTIVRLGGFDETAGFALRPCEQVLEKIGAGEVVAFLRGDERRAVRKRLLREKAIVNGFTPSLLAVTTPIASALFDLGFEIV